MAKLDQCLCEYGLNDLRYSGHRLTWHNKQPSNSILRKLDRVVVNYCWEDLLGVSRANFLPPGASDHSLIVVCLERLKELKNLNRGNFFEISNRV